MGSTSVLTTSERWSVQDQEGLMPVLGDTKWSWNFRFMLQANERCRFYIVETTHEIAKKARFVFHCLLGRFIAHLSILKYVQYILEHSAFQ